MNTSSYDSVVKNTVTAKHSVFQISKTYPAFLTLIIGLLLSFFVWKFVDNTIQSDRESAFEKATSSVMTRLDAAYDRQFQILNSFEGLYKNSYQVVRGVFELYGEIPTRTYSSILSVNYVPFVPGKEKNEFIYYAMSERYYNYDITPSGKRDFYYPIEYIVPLDRNIHRSGFDYSTQKQAFETMERARKYLGKIVSSEFYDVRPDTIGFLMMFAVKKKVVDSFAVALKGDKIDGLVMLELDAKAFFNTNITDNPVPTDTSIYFSCIDQAASSKTNIFSSANSNNLGKLQPLMTGSRILKIADRDVTIQFATVPSFGSGFQGNLSLFALIGGIIISFVGFGFILSVVTARGRAIDLAERITRSQRRIVESSQDIIAVMDLQGNWKSLSIAVNKSLEYSEDELINKNIKDSFLLVEDVERLKIALDTSKEDLGFTFEVQSLTKSSEVKWISWHLTTSRTDGLIYAIGRDITLQKSMEEQNMLRNKQVQLAELSAIEANNFKARFMRDLGHNIRDTLTGTMGFLQLLSLKDYSDIAEQDEYIENAVDCTEKMFNYVTNISDVADDTISQEDITPVKVKFNEVFPLIEKAFNSSNEYEKHISFTVEEDGSSTAMIVNKKLFCDLMTNIILALSGGMKSAEINVTVRANTYEKAVEIEMLSTVDETVSKLIQIYKNESTNLVDALPKDKNDVIFNLGFAASSLRRLGGSLMVDSLGVGEQNVAMITVPLARGK